MKVNGTGNHSQTVLTKIYYSKESINLLKYSHVKAIPRHFGAPSLWIIPLGPRGKNEEQVHVEQQAFVITEADNSNKETALLVTCWSYSFSPGI